MISNRLQKLINIIAKRPLRFQSGDIAARVRAVNRRNRQGNGKVRK